MRTKLPDGSYQTERYAFGNGGCTPGHARDDSIDSLPFLAVAAELVDPLASVGYLSSKDPNATQLLIMVHWGTTVSPSDMSALPIENGAGLRTKQIPPTWVPQCGNGGRPQPTVNLAEASANSAAMTSGFENRVRDRLNRHNAQVLGFEDELQKLWGFGSPPVIRAMGADIIDDLEDARYFVVLVAYDFQKAWKAKKLEVQWTTRFSLRTRGNRFDQQLPVMAQHAASFFGGESDGLVRDYLPSNGQVTLGPTEVLGQE